jgi:hypothetical protein
LRCYWQFDNYLYADLFREKSTYATSTEPVSGHNFHAFAKLATRCCQGIV